MTSQTHRLTPVPESPRDPVLPDRGTEDHGVPVEHEPAIDPTVDWDLEHVRPDTEPLEHAIPIVPVRIVEEDSRDIRDWRPNIYSIPAPATSTDPIRLVGENQRRTRLFVRNNHATEGVVLLRKRTDNVAYGYPLAGGASVEIFAETEVCAVHATAGTNAVELAVLEEFRVSKGG